MEWHEYIWEMTRIQFLGSVPTRHQGRKTQKSHCKGLILQGEENVCLG